MAESKIVPDRYFLFELVCRKCGETAEARLTQFDELPNCPKCDNEMLAESASKADAG